MIPKYRMWNEIISRLHSVDGLYFDREVAQYKDEVGVSRLIKFQNAIIMQSTGLEDANGNEIFEADVLRNNAQEYIFLVRYDYDNCRWFGEGITINTRIDITRDVLKYYSKIGNRWESPELLKEENATK